VDEAATADAARRLPPQPIEVTPARSARFREPAQSWKSLHQQHVVMQKYDYSCGAAALTTLIVYYFQDPMTEQKVLDAIFDRLSRGPQAQAVIQDRIQNGLSLLDLQQVAADLGYQSAVARITMEQTANLRAPVVVRIIKNDFKHFVVLRGIVEDRVYLADPIRGQVRMPVQEFVRQWNGVALFLGKAGFGLPKEYPLAIRATPPVQHELQAARRAQFWR
jgi:predicted double-glycine peptidase